jgi:Protein of unknown function (DUF4038)/Domain of unknown function (DUF5060)
MNLKTAFRTSRFPSILCQLFLCLATVCATASEQWRVDDTVFNLPEDPASPFEVKATASFIGPNDEKLDVPLFFNGGREFVLRFAPPAPGEWKFTTRSEVKELDGRSGVLQAAPAAKGRHGPVGISSSSKQQFAHADGTGYFPIAFECDWLFALDAGNKTGIPKTLELADTIARHGFNQVVMNVYAYDVTWPADPKLPPAFNYARPDYSPFGGSNDAPDFSTLNVGFFQHLDRVIAALDERGIIAHLMIYVWNKKVNWPESRSEADNRYFDYVVKRYQAYPNLIWDISKEATGYGHNDMGYITDRIERLRKLDGFDRLVTVHDYGYCAKHPELVDFVSIQLWTSELFAAMKEVRAKHSQKPIFNIEHGGYEAGPYHVFTGDYLSAEACLERAYQCVFAGTFPTHYWQDTSWSVVIHNPDSLPENQRPKLHYYRHLAALVSEPGFADLEPATQKFSSSGMCLTDGKTRFVYFIPKENSAVQLRKLPAKLGQPLKLTWFNPITGESLPPMERKNQQYISVERPDWDHFGILKAEVLP